MGVVEVVCIAHGLFRLRQSNSDGSVNDRQCCCCCYAYAMHQTNPAQSTRRQQAVLNRQNRQNVVCSLQPTPCVHACVNVNDMWAEPSSGALKLWMNDESMNEKGVFSKMNERRTYRALYAVSELTLLHSTCKNRHCGYAIDVNRCRARRSVKLNAPPTSKSNIFKYAY